MIGALTPLDWAVIVAYLVFALAVGVVFTRRAGKSVNEFFISGRTLPWWLAGTSMVATSFASDTPLVITGWVRTKGIHFNWLWWSFAIGGMFSVFLLARLWRRAETVTDVELTELRYGGRSAAVLRGFRAVYMALPVNCITMAWVTVAMVKLMDVLLGIPPLWSIGACIVLTTVYAALSGFWGVVVTDLVQFVLAMVGSIGLCVFAVRGAGGLAALKAEAVSRSDLGREIVSFYPMPPPGASPLSGEFWSGPVFAFGVFMLVQWWANKNADGGGVVVQRMLAARDERQSLLATLWFNVANYALRPWPWILVALASVVLVPEPSQGDAERAYPDMMLAYVPPGLLGVMVASFLGAFMSTIDTHLNLSSAYLVNDVYRRFVRPEATERHYVRVSRLASVAVMLVASGIALASGSISAMFQFLLAFTSGIGLVYILRWFWWRVNAYSEIAAMAASGGIASAFYVFRLAGPEVFGPAAELSGQAILVLTVLVSTALWVAVTYLTPPVSMEKLVAFYRKVRPYGVWGPVARAAGVEPPRDFGRLVLAWIAGTVMVLGATLGIGKLLLLEWVSGGLYLGAAAMGAVAVALEVRRLFPGVGGRGDLPPPVTAEGADR